MQITKTIGYKAKLNDYVENGGLNRGVSTGWGELDRIYSMMLGSLNVTVGIPSSGKSEWHDQLMLHTVKLHEWKWAVFSPENWPLTYHCTKLCEKWMGKPMFGPNAMAVSEREDALDIMGNHINFLEPDSDELPTIEGILEACAYAVDAYGVKGILIDPWNEIARTKPRDMNDTDHIGWCLSELRNFARRHDVSMNLIAHPTKMQKKEDGTYPIPTPYDIAGSAMFRNKSDNCISIWRDYNVNDGWMQVHITKVRNKMVGTLGKVDMHWEWETGLYSDSFSEKTPAIKDLRAIHIPETWRNPAGDA